MQADAARIASLGLMSDERGRRRTWRGSIPGLMLWLGILASLGAVDARAAQESQPDQEPQGATPTMAKVRDLWLTGEYEEAEQAYETLAQESEHALEAQLGLVQLDLHLGRYEAARQRLDALQADESLHAEDAADWHYWSARTAQILGDYDAVLDHAKTAFAKERRHAAARLLYAQQLEALGRREDAIQAYRWCEQQVVGQASLPRDAAWITDVAAGFIRYSELTQTELAFRTKHALHNMLQVAYTRVDRLYWPGRIVAADLLRSKYSNDESDGSVSDYEGALRINPKLPVAQVGLGSVALEGWQFEEVDRRIGLALEVNPQYAPAFHLRAMNRMLERRYDLAVEACNKALAINPHDLTALSVQAAAYACQFDDTKVAAIEAEITRLNPCCGQLHSLVGLALSGVRQYAASERALLRAIECDPTDVNARTELGMMYMQWGEEAKARVALEAAWAIDPYNERTKFTLELLEELEAFARHETEHFIILYDEVQDPGLGPWIAPFLEDIYPQITGDFAHEPAEKTIIEVFPNHRAFGVRITGRPWVHTVGACTGRVIAVDSPRESVQLQGAYNLGGVLRHEFTHTVTLAATGNRIPHWYTEALAVMQEEMPRSWAWQELLAERTRRGMLFSIADINWGFIRPQRPGDRQAAYAQSEWMAEFIVERFGYESLNHLLEHFRDGRRQEDTLEELFQMDEQQFDDAFATWAREQATSWGFDLTPPEHPKALRAAVLVAPEEAGLRSRLARAEFDHERYEEAMEAARAALELDPKEPLALEVLARVLHLLAKQDPLESARTAYENEALEVLARLDGADPDSWIAPKLEAEILLRRGRLDDAEKPLETLQQRCPRDPASWQGLAAVYLDRGDDTRALPQLLELARIQEHDADVPGKIAQIYRRRGQAMEALYWYRRALMISPFNVRMQGAYGETALLADEPATALRAFRMLMRLEPEESKHYAQAAFAAQKAGDADEAIRLAKEAVKRDPDSPARSLLP
jgi:tetratricopeptide (TPR) repeat protein